jgi:hypothetical protein
MIRVWSQVRPTDEKLILAMRKAIDEADCMRNWDARVYDVVWIAVRAEVNRYDGRLWEVRDRESEGSGGSD